MMIKGPARLILRQIVSLGVPEVVKRYGAEIGQEQIINLWT